MEGRGEEGRRGREGDEIGKGGGCKRLVRGRDRGVASSSSSAIAPSTPRRPCMNACREERDREDGR